MEQRDLTFVIPTYRLRDVGETVEQYDQHLCRNGHSVRLMHRAALIIRDRHERDIRVVVEQRLHVVRMHHAVKRRLGGTSGEYPEPFGLVMIEARRVPSGARGAV